MNLWVIIYWPRIAITRVARRLTAGEDAPYRRSASMSADDQVEAALVAMVMVRSSDIARQIAGERDFTRRLRLNALLRAAGAWSESIERQMKRPLLAEDGR